MKISELLETTDGATSTSSIGTVVSPWRTGTGNANTAYTGTPGKPGKKRPKEVLPADQTPDDNALNNKEVGLMGQPLIKR